MATFDSVSMECLSTSFVPEYFGFGILGFFALSTLVLTFRLRVARVQVFFRTLLQQSGCGVGIKALITTRSLVLGIFSCGTFFPVCSC